MRFKPTEGGISGRADFYEEVNDLVDLMILKGLELTEIIASLLCNSNITDLMENIALERMFISDEDFSKVDAFENIIKLLVPFYMCTSACNYRGAILELFGFKLLCGKYGCSLPVSHNFSSDFFDKDCKIIIKTDDYSYKTEKTVDILAITSDKSYGECYECKTQYIKKEVIETLNKIHDESNGNLVTGILSFGEENAINHTIEDIIDSSGGLLKNENILVISRNNFFDLIDTNHFNVPELI